MGVRVRRGHPLDSKEERAGGGAKQWSGAQQTNQRNKTNLKAKNRKQKLKHLFVHKN